MYEVEYKVEITGDERAELINLFTKEGFKRKETVTQENYYIEAEESPYGGYDIKRYRDEGKKIIYTEKIWETYNEEKVRKEREEEVSRNVFLTEIEKYPNILKIKKDRASFIGKFQNREIHIDMDSVKFDHSHNMRYFIEAEILVENQEEVRITRDLVLAFLRSAIGREDIKESPGMFAMAYKKL